MASIQKRKGKNKWRARYRDGGRDTPDRYGEWRSTLGEAEADLELIEERQEADKPPVDITEIPKEFCGDWYKCPGDSFSMEPVSYEGQTFYGSVRYHVTPRGFSQATMMPRDRYTGDVEVVMPGRPLMNEKFQLAKEDGQLVLIRLTPEGLDRGDMTPKYIFTPPDKITERTTVHQWPNGRAEAYYIIR